MDAGQRTGRAFPQTGVALQKVGVGVASVDGGSSPVVGRLQSQLHRQHRPLGQFAEQGHRLLGQTVGAGGDVHAHHSRPRQRLLEQRAQHRHRSVSVRPRLEVGDAPLGGPLFGEKSPLAVVLLPQGHDRGLGKVAASPPRAVDAPAHAAPPVHVGAGKSRVQGDLGALAPEGGFQPSVVGVVALVGIRQGEYAPLAVLLLGHVLTSSRFCLYYT